MTQSKVYILYRVEQSSYQGTFEYVVGIYRNEAEAYKASDSLKETFSTYFKVEEGDFFE